MTARTAEDPTAPLSRRWPVAEAALRRLEWVALGVITLVPIGLVLYAGRHGLNVTPDSVGYVAAARSFASSGAFIYWDGTPFTHWPFGYPLLLSLPLALGLSPESAAMAINVLALAALVLATYAVARQALASPVLGLVAAGFSGVAGDTLRDEVSLLTEPLFLVACLGLIVGLGLIARGGLSRPRLLVVVGCATAGELLRYIGISLVPVIGLSILVIEWRRGWLRAGLVAAGVACLSALGTLVVAVHNLLTIGSLTGSFGPSQATPASLGKIALTVFGQWLLPTASGSTPPLVLGAALVALAVLGSVALLRERGRRAVPLVAFAALYPAALLGSELRVDGYLDAR
ncbi:MAG TPA: hypothetical protein VFW20_07935, partial [Candidatus Limnocylindrales bacterium]|nr:hypothetical protein [Candidatus Limnocylindrales bacterium]